MTRPGSRRRRALHTGTAGRSALSVFTQSRWTSGQSVVDYAREASRPPPTNGSTRLMRITPVLGRFYSGLQSRRSCDALGASLSYSSLPFSFFLFRYERRGAGAKEGRRTARARDEAGKSPDQEGTTSARKLIGIGLDGGASVRGRRRAAFPTARRR